MKQFDEWNEVKKNLDKKEIILKFKPRDIFFMSVGQNIGYEVFGKGVDFLRPVLVYKKLSKETFIGIPLTSKIKEGTYFFTFNHKNKKSTAMFNQIRVYDIKRAKVDYGRISYDTFIKLEIKMLEFMKVTSHEEK